MAKKKAAPKKAKPAASDQAADKPVDELTPAMKRRLDHLTAIESQNVEVQKKMLAVDNARQEHADAKKELENAIGELRLLIAEGPDPQQRLGFPEDGAEGSADAPAAGPKWKRRNVDVLGLTAGVLKKLDALGIGTLGDLKDYWDAGKMLHNEKGWGPETAAKVADHWATYQKEHPETWHEHDLPPEDGETGDDQDAAGNDADE